MLHSHLSHGKEIRELQITQMSVWTALPTTCLLLILKTVAGLLGKLSQNFEERMRTLSRSFYLVAAEKATLVTSSSTGTIQENSARVLALAGSAQTGTV